jgi:hypothetical protein
MKCILLLALATLLANSQATDTVKRFSVLPLVDANGVFYFNTTGLPIGVTNSSLPTMNAVATCGYKNPCSYTVPSGWMLQFSMAASARFTFTVTSNGPFYADYGPDTHHYFSGSCCNFGINTVAPACYGNFGSKVSYYGTCPTTCPTIIGYWNQNSYTTTMTVTIYGASGPM